MFPGVCPQVDGYLNGKKVFSTSIKKNSTKPIWNEYQEIFIESVSTDDIELVVTDSRVGVKLGSIAFHAEEVKDLGVMT